MEFHETPPGIAVRYFRILISEGINESGPQQFGELAPFLISEPGIADVGSGILNVHLSMGNIEVTAYHYRLVFLMRKTSR